MDPPTLEVLPDLTLLKIISYLDIESLANLAESVPDMKSFMSRDYVLHDLSLVHRLPFVSTIDQFFIYSELGPLQLTGIAAANGDVRYVKAILDAYPGNSELIPIAIKKASSFGHIDIVRFILSLGQTRSPTLHSAMSAAVEGGHLDLVKLMIENKPEDGYDINGILGLSISHDKNMIFLFILGYELREHKDKLSYGTFMERAAGRGNNEIVKFLFSFTNYISAKNYNESLVLSIRRGYIETAKIILNFVRQLTANSKLNPGDISYDNFISEALIGGHIELI